VLAAIAASVAVSFQILLPVVPVLVERQGPSGAAGAATAALFSGAVIGELCSPWLMTRWSSTRLLIAGQLLFGLPSLVYTIADPGPLLMLAAAVLRGLGFGVSIVVAVALVTRLSSPHWRGRSIGYFGLALSLPGIALPSVGVFLLEHGQLELDAIIACAAGLAGTVLATRLPADATARVSGAGSLLQAARQPGVLVLFLGFVLMSCSFGGIFTYTPIALPADGLGSAAIFLFVAGAWRALGRWLAGVLGDHRPPRLVLGTGIALTLAGLVALAVGGRNPIAVIFAASAYGIGYGGVQTGVYLVMTLGRGGTNWGGISALWNSAVDLGSSLGGVVVGLSAARVGYAGAVWVLPAVVLLAVPLFFWRGGVQPVPAVAETEPSG
jgi:predicted MFS family arabinose efflux permease